MTASDWKKYYQTRLISAEEAANLVKPGDQVVFTTGRESFAVGFALAARIGELKNVKLTAPTPTYDFGWYDSGWEDSFKVTVRRPTATCQEAVDARRCDFDPGSLIPFLDVDEVYQADVCLTEISAPDEHGFCSFGNSLWAKKRQIALSKMTIAEVNENLIRTCGDNYIHVSEIDYFVKHISSGQEFGSGTLAGRELKEPEPYIKQIAENIALLINDGDTLQIGVGRTTEPLVSMGVFDSKNDLGWHSEATPPGIISLVKRGLINGKRKTINQGKAVCTSIGGGTKDEMAWVHQNPLFWLVDVGYLEDIRVIAAHDNFVAINNALAIDLSGQIASETIGTQQIGSAGGQIPFAFGAWLSKGGSSITVLPSTAKNGITSRIMPRFSEGTVITLQRNCADYIVTEYGIARLRGKTLHQRAEALIAIAHPDFRADLNREAKKLLWPRNSY
ncbi:acetyl-CoA hydrolase/transferase family protein [Chloroflexota bacterium]